MVKASELLNYMLAADSQVMAQGMFKVDLLSQALQLNLPIQLHFLCFVQDLSTNGSALVLA